MTRLKTNMDKTNSKSLSPQIQEDYSCKKVPKQFNQLSKVYSKETRVKSTQLV